MKFALRNFGVVGLAAIVLLTGCARKKPLTPPAMNIEINPKAKSDAELMRNFAP